MATLAERLARELANAAPSRVDPEDDETDVTSARIVFESRSQSTDDHPVSRSDLRSKNAALLGDIDPKYAGRTVSRRALQVYDEDGEGEKEESQSMSEDDHSDADSDGGGDEDIEEIASDTETTLKLMHTESDESEREDNASVDSDDQSGVSEEQSGTEPRSGDGDNDDGSVASQEVLSNASHLKKASRVRFSVDGSVRPAPPVERGPPSGEGIAPSAAVRLNIAEDVAKGQAVQKQLKLWESILELRIKMQKVLNAANRLPQPDCWSRYCTNGSNEEARAEQAQSSLYQVLDTLLTLQQRLMPPSGQTTSDKPDIVSSKRRLEEYEDVVSKRFKAFSTYRDEAVQKWDDKTRLASRKVGSKTAFEGFEQSALRIIGQIMTDKERLLKRTQLKRSAYSVIGQQPKQLLETPASTDEPSGSGRVQEYDEELFDDDDFYHQLLRELIEQKTAATSDPIALSRQWMELQKLRTKVKKNVDTKASKGRKVRYDAHPKLVNFMAPIDKAEAWEDEQRDELFSSLLGQRYEALRSVT